MIHRRILFQQHALTLHTMARRILLTLCLLFATYGFAATTHDDLLVHFEKDESTLTQEATAELDAFIATLTIRGDYVFTVHGHTDSDGPEDYNEALSQARAETVSRYLTDHGVDPRHVRIQRSGERDPLATNRHDEGMAQNRRVHLTFTRHSYADTEELRRALMEGSVQRFTIDPTAPQVVVGSTGTQLSFAAHAFVDASGRPVQGPVEVELTEAVGLQAMLAHQLSTRSGARMLETGGMLQVRATDVNGADLRLQASSPMQVSLPATDQEEGMELFVSDDGADWTATSTPLPVTKVTTWREPPYPIRPRIAFRWPQYLEDQKGKPVKPSEPTPPREPIAPREMSYKRKLPWWAFLFPERAKERSEFNYKQALHKFDVQRARYEKKLAAFELECANYPERLERYAQRKADWEALKKVEYDAWHTNIYLPAQARYNALMEPLRLRYDSLRADYEQVRNASMQEYVLRADSLNSADMGGVNAYVFSTTTLGWINCDRFINVPEEDKYVVVANAPRQTDAQVFLVFDRIRSVLQMGRNAWNNYASPSVARAEPATVFAYTVIDGQAHVCMRPASPSAEVELRFEPSSIAEIGDLLHSLAGMDS